VIGIQALTGRAIHLETRIDLPVDRIPSPFGILYIGSPLN